MARPSFVQIIITCVLLTGYSDASSSLSYLMDYVICSLSETFYGSECCRSARVNFRYNEFCDEIKKHLFGQPMAADVVAKAVSDHWDSRQLPRKALVLSLHGPPGVGKTYITQILAKYTFAKGEKSQFYQLLSATRDFPHDEDMAVYNKRIRDLIFRTVSSCEKALFVFDEVDKMPVKLLDSLKPYVDYGSVIDGVDFSRSIFIFLSNIGSGLITKGLADWKRQGRGRDDFVSQSWERQLSEHAFKDENGGLKESLLLRHYLISRFVPFLPLEREHVILCIKEYLAIKRNEGLVKDDKFIDGVLREIIFVPDEEQFFSSSGCKRVPDKVDEALEALSYRRDVKKPKTSREL